ncbi:MAG: hypothetical protein ACTSUE_11245 [Promethearchaeota archaeon]
MSSVKKKGEKEEGMISSNQFVVEKVGAQPPQYTKEQLQWGYRNTQNMRKGVWAPEERVNLFNQLTKYPQYCSKEGRKKKWSTILSMGIPTRCGWQVANYFMSKKTWIAERPAKRTRRRTRRRKVIRKKNGGKRRKPNPMLLRDPASSPESQRVGVKRNKDQSRIIEDYHDDQPAMKRRKIDADPLDWSNETLIENASDLLFTDEELGPLALNMPTPPPMFVQ